MCTLKGIFYIWKSTQQILEQMISTWGFLFDFLAKLMRWIKLTYSFSWLYEIPSRSLCLNEKHFSELLTWYHAHLFLVLLRAADGGLGATNCVADNHSIHTWNSWAMIFAMMDGQKMIILLTYHTTYLDNIIINVNSLGSERVWRQVLLTFWSFLHWYLWKFHHLSWYATAAVRM